MRDPKRIPEILKLLQECWENVPDWRFGQLIENLKRYIGSADLFYIEDDKLVQYIKEFFRLDEEIEEEQNDFCRRT